ncbi:VOC family protein [Amphibacillus sediminis]|uniref:VOC family protein n=1 Tax=Amphibacillus sediminis TaxID=360185 RepID=UPI000829A80D|nr:VOC family protein [Amphibacillus sediminis]
MSKLVWDHTVHYVNDLEHARGVFNQHNITAFFGGSHKHWGTYNVLSYFDLTYLEFLAIEDRERAEAIKDPNQVVLDAVRLLPDHEGLSRLALRTDDIEVVRQQLLNQDIQVSPIMAGKRYDGNGHLIEWKMMTIAGDFQGLPYPFVIQWSESDHERRERLKNERIISEHPAGNLSMHKAVFQVPDPVATVSHWSTIFQLEKSNPTELVTDGKYFVFKQGNEAKLAELVIKANYEQIIKFSGACYRLTSTNF